MKMIGKGLYASAMVKRFLLPQEIEQVINIPSIVEALMFVKVNIEKKRRKTYQVY
jgi:hypothetical protein